VKFVKFEEKIFSSFPALRHRNFRLFWFGQCISLIGTWMQNIGQAWLVLKLTNSPFLLGLITTLQTLPVLIFALFAGVFVDRFPKQKLVVFSQAGLMVIALALSALTFTGKVKYWHVAVLATLLGMLNTIDNPSRQSLMIELVGKDDLMNAIALNSSIFNLARIIGPAIAGILIGYLGIGLCFLLNGISFIAVIAGLLMMDVKEDNRSKESKVSSGVMKEMAEGLKYVFKTPNIYTPILLMLFINVFAMNFNVLVPVFTKMELGMEASQYGLLMAAMGTGALLGALILATRVHAEPKMKYLFAGAFGLSLFQGMAGLTHNYYLAMIFLCLTGFCMIIFTAMCNTTIQINAENYIRGRVMSLYSLVFIGMTTVGSLYTGSLSEYSGAGTTFIVSAIIGMVSCVVLYFFGRKSSVKF
jgi:MFS family permease